MSNKLKGSPRAVGYWGRDPNKRTEAEEIPQKVRVLLQDKLLTRGKKARLFTEVTADTPNSLVCSCVKETTDRADITCASCYGTGFIPGYKAFLHDTIYFASITQGAIFTNTKLDTNIKPNRVILDDLQISGSYTSPRIQYSNPFDSDWEFRADAPNILNTNTIAISFSTDGVNFYDLLDINGSNKPTGIGGIYFRVTMTRSNVQDRSPEFQILRLRAPMKREPFIQILRPQISELPTLTPYGKRQEQLGERFWTMPLDFFDETIPANTDLARIVENSFYERIDGIFAGQRYVTVKLMYDEEFGIFTYQSFEARRAQPEEVYSRVVF